jgi:predicted acetyltransferase
MAWWSVFCSSSVAGVYAVGTLPEARRQGIGSAITLRGLRDARERGYRVGVLQSSQMGYNLYRRFGFENCFVIKSYAKPRSLYDIGRRRLVRTVWRLAVGSFR